MDSPGQLYLHTSGRSLRDARAPVVRPRTDRQEVRDCERGCTGPKSRARLSAMEPLEKRVLVLHADGRALQASPSACMAVPGSAHMERHDDALPRLRIPEGLTVGVAFDAPHIAVAAMSDSVGRLVACRPVDREVRVRISIALTRKQTVHPRDHPEAEL